MTRVFRHTVVVQQANAAVHARLMGDMFRQRARVFGDKLGWDVTVVDGQERDKYDDLAPVYIICTNECAACNGEGWTEATEIYPDGSYATSRRCPRCKGASSRVTGSLRLLPTTGPTLLDDVFADTLPDAIFCAPTIWECTRFCAEDHDTAASLIAALGEVGLKSGIESIVGNFDVAMLRIYRRIGCEVQVLGSTRRHGRTVFLGSFPITEAILRKVKKRLAAVSLEIA